MTKKKLKKLQKEQTRGAVNIKKRGLTSGNNSMPVGISAFLIAVVTFIVFSPSLKNGFTNWDDSDYVLQNPLVVNNSVPVKEIFQTPVMGNYHPMTMLTLAWTVICTKDPYEARRNARLQDASSTFLFVLVISAATASLFAVGLLLRIAKQLSPTGLAAYIALAVTAVFLSWMLVHTIFTLRYAHIYFHDARKVEREDIPGDIMFPGKHSPDYLDFAYFSFVIGMTCQVSDVQIASRNVRRLALVHGLISFAFNTAILAIFVNIIAGLVGQ